MKFFKSLFNIAGKVNNTLSAINMYINPPAYTTKYNTYIKSVFRNPSVACAYKNLDDNFININFKVAQKVIVEENGKKVEKQEIVANEWIDKTLKKPSEITSKTEFKKYLLFYFLFGGRVLIEKFDHMASSSLIMYAPNSFELMYATSGIKLDYIQFATQNIKGDELKRYHFLKDMDPEAQIAGYSAGSSRLEALVAISDLINFIIVHNNTLLQNGGHKAGFFKSNKDLKTDKQRDEFESKLKAAISGYNNAGKISVLPGDIEFVPTDVNPKDLDWSTGWVVAHKMIANLMGVPLTMVWDSSSTYNNTKEDKVRLYKQTLIPIAKIFAEYLTDIFEDNLEEGQEIIVDLSSIEELKEDVMETLKGLDGISYLTVNEKRNIASQTTGVQISPYQHENADKILINSMVTPIEEINVETSLDENNGVERDEEEENQKED